MKLSRLNRSKTGFFSAQQLDFCYRPSAYSSFIRSEFSIEAIKEQMELKNSSFSGSQRRILVDRLSDILLNESDFPAPQYRTLLSQNIKRLGDKNTYTITTGHQLVAFTGPLYLIYKIAHTIRLCTLLSEHYPDCHFVPVFWLASEDHDYEEIRSFHLFNRTFSWDTDQVGPVGRFSMKDWEQVISEVGSLFKNNAQSEIFKLFDFFNGSNYAQAYMRLISHLFGRYGVVVVNGDDRIFKEQFVPYMLEELQTRFSYKSIQETTKKLVDAGGKEQIIPRPINLFYIGNMLRERLIEHEDTGLIEIPSSGFYSVEELTEQIKAHPENFSPNVSLRPLYQEILLPNLCYIGGAGEISYWLQLKGVFDHLNVPFPLLQVRNSILWIDKNTAEKIRKLQLTSEDLFKDLHILQREYMERYAGEEIDFTLIDEQLSHLQNQLLQTTKNIDISLETYAIAENVRLEKQIQHIKEKLYKSVKSKHDQNIKTLQHIKEKLFPNGQLQERYTNFFQLAPDGNYSEVLHQIIENMQVLSSDFIIMEEEAEVTAKNEHLSN